jgi:uncharacterized protein (UPF0276 family)
VRWPDLPKLGCGVGYRLEVHREYFKHKDGIDFLEIIADHCLKSVPEYVDRALELAQHFPLVPHGLEMSIGTDGPLDVEYCREVAELVEKVGTPFYSDHLCFTTAGGLEMGQLTPLPFTEAVADRCAAKARQVQETIGVPFLLENITYPFKLPGQMSEAEFITRVVTQADCGILLDLTNVFINSQNHRYDPYRFLDSLPLERAVQVHIAGGEKHGDRWVDSHSQPVDSHPEVWNLLEYLGGKADVSAVLLERDQNFPEDFAEILDDLAHAREILG